MRDKEMKQDYRFMPEPNLPPLRLYDSDTIGGVTVPDAVINVDQVRQTLPRLPKEIREDLQQTYDLSLHYTSMLFVSWVTEKNVFMKYWCPQLQQISKWLFLE